MEITRGDVATALSIMQEAAAWLIESGRPLWRLEDLSAERILANASAHDVAVGWIEGQSAAALVLSEQDPLFWPAAGDDSAYIHKLSVRRRFAGGRVSRQMVAWAHAEAIRLGKTYLRLDCSAERPKLCGFYTSLGFRMVERRMVGPFDEAFFELRLD